MKAVARVMQQGWPLRYISQLDRLFDCGCLEMLRNRHKKPVLALAWNMLEPSRFRGVNRHKRLHGFQKNCLHRGMIDYITKPVDFDRLAGIMMGQLGTVRPSDLQKDGA